MDRRRLEHAHMHYAMLNVAKWYEGSFKIKSILFSSDQSQTTLSEFTPLYLKAFYEQYSGKPQNISRNIKYMISQDTGALKQVVGKLMKT